MLRLGSAEKKCVRAHEGLRSEANAKDYKNNFKKKGIQHIPLGYLVRGAVINEDRRGKYELIKQLLRLKYSS